MNTRALLERIWGTGDRPPICANCGRNPSTVFLANRQPPPDVLNPMYLCRPCYQRLVIRAMQVEGFLVVDVQGLFDELAQEDPMQDIWNAQADKQRDWRN